MDKKILRRQKNDGLTLFMSYLPVFCVFCVMLFFVSFWIAVFVTIGYYILRFCFTIFLQSSHPKVWNKLFIDEERDKMKMREAANEVKKLFKK